MMSSQAVGDLSFLHLRNCSRLPGKLPSPPVERKRLPSEEQKVSTFNIMEGLILAATILGFVLVIIYLRDKLILGVHLWKLELLLLVLVGSRIVWTCVVYVIVKCLEKLFRSRNWLMYVVYKVQQDVKRSMIAWGFVVAWTILFGELEVSLDNPILKTIDKVLTGSAIVISLWAMKSGMVMVLAAWIHIRTYHEKILESLFFWYVLEGLSGPPLIELSSYLPPGADLGFGDLQKLNPRDLSSWEMKKMMRTGKEKGFVAKIKTEVDARIEAEKIFLNVAKPNSQFIVLEDLKRFLQHGEALKALKTLNLFRRTYEYDENIQISLFCLQEWMVQSFKRHMCLLLSLEDMDAASDTIGLLFNIVIGIFIAAFSLPLLGWSSPKILIALTTNVVVITFLFGQICKELFFSIHLLYIRHPYDVGDEIEIDEVEMFVEKLKITETIFIGRDKKKCTLVNFEICSKLVKNNSRSELPAWTMEDIV